MQSNPLVSIIIPCYNQEEFIADALQSVYEQTYDNWECIVMNDGSVDSSEKEILKWIDKDKRFKYFYKENSGVADTRNQAVSHAQGEYILPLDGDDKLNKHYIEKALNIFRQNADTKLVYSDPILFGAKNDIINTVDYSFTTILYENMIPCTALFRKEDFNKTSGYRSNMTYGLEDWDFWISFLSPEDIVIKLSENLIYYRIKESSRSTLLKDQENKNELMLVQMFINNKDKYLLFFNPVRDHINHLHYKAMTEMLQASPEYRIGKIIYAPFRFISKIFRKIFG